MLDDRRPTLAFDGFECILTTTWLQLCVSPDYVLIPREAQDAFLLACTQVYVLSSMIGPPSQLYSLVYSHKSFFGDSEDPSKSDSYSRIISEAHTKRIKRYIDETKGKVVLGGQSNVENRYIAPTIVRDVPVNDSLMEE